MFQGWQVPHGHFPVCWISLTVSLSCWILFLCFPLLLQIREQICMPHPVILQNSCWMGKCRDWATHRNYSWKFSSGVSTVRGPENAVNQWRRGMGSVVSNPGLWFSMCLDRWDNRDPSSLIQPTCGNWKWGTWFLCFSKRALKSVWKWHQKLLNW